MNISEITQQLSYHGFHSRQGQKRMIQAVAASVCHNHILLCEGGTGIGKSFGYLLGALTQLKPKQKVVIATATIQLMEQLLTKDIAQVAKILKRSFDVQVAKGRRRYLCHQALYQHDDLVMLEKTARLRQTLEQEDWNGDRDRLAFQIEDALWQQVSTDRAGCLKHRCTFFKECCFFKAREQQKSADIIVTTHASLLADVYLGLGTLLPEPEHTVYIIDEAHHLPEQSIQSLAKHLSLQRHHDITSESRQLLLTCKRLLSSQVPASFYQAISQPLEAMSKVLDDFEALLKLNFHNHANSDKQWVILGPLPEALADSSQHLATHSQSVAEALSMLLTSIYENPQIRKKQDQEALQQLCSRLDYISDALAQYHDLYHTFSQPDQTLSSACARWISMQSNNKNKQDYLLHTSAIDTSQILNERLWQQTSNAVVLCSATLKIENSFKHFATRLGLQLQNKHELKAISCLSPFAYQESQLIIPKQKFAPSHKDDAHLQEFQSFLAQYLKQCSQGTLVLFASQKSLQQSFAELKPTLQKKVICQGDLPKNQLISRFKGHIDKGQAKALFGLQSLAEGIDLPGKYCQTLIIHKIPFAGPNSPEAKTREYWLKQHNKNVFIEHTLPETNLKLIQWAGRLIRSENDRGTLILFDDRILYKPYGKKLLASLPPFQLHCPSCWQDTLQLLQTKTTQSA